MTRMLGCSCLAAGLFVVVLASGRAAAQNPPNGPAAEGPYRRLAPGVMETVPPDKRLQETVTRHNLVELLAVDPNLDWARNVPVRRDVWCLEFKFKPVRMIWVDVPQASGQMRRKLIWYMVYSVTNSGKVMHPVQDAPLPYDTSDKPLLHEVKYVDEPVRFIPNFLLQGYESISTDPDKGGFVKAYPDRVIPVALGPIQTREDPNRRLLNSVEMCRDIAVGETLWGVATWEDVNPLIDRFSIYVKGLTNAYRWSDEPGAFKKEFTTDPNTYRDYIGTGRTLYQKALKLNFWRPGDEYFEHEGEIRYGVPGQPDTDPGQPGGKKRVPDFEWVYLAVPRGPSSAAAEPAQP
jgi:hypothetical protein